MSDFDIFSH